MSVEKARRAAYQTRYEGAPGDPVILDLIATAQAIKDPMVRCGAWDMIGHIIQSAKEPAPPQEG